MEHFRPRCGWPSDLTLPVPIDPTGSAGPTRGAAGGPHWRRTSPQRYVPSSTVERVEQRILEQAQRLPPGGAVGGWAALRLLGAAYFGGEDQPVPLVVERPENLRPGLGVRVLRQVGSPVALTSHGIPCTDPVSALLDVAQQEPDLRRRVVALDMALAAGVVPRRVLEQVRGRRGVQRLQEALALADGRSASPPESWLRLVWVLDAGLPVPRVNWPVFAIDGYPLGRPDLVCEECGVVVEYDGAAHGGTARRRRDAERRDDYRAAGLEVVTVVGGGPGREQAVSRQLLGACDRSAAWVRPRGWRLGVL